MANERIKEKVEPVSPATVEEAIKDTVSTKTEVITQKIYVGPNLLGLPTYMVVESKFTPHIENFIKECPEIEKLFVPISEMAEVENRAKTKGTLEHRYFNTIREFKMATREGDK